MQINRQALQERQIDNEKAEMAYFLLMGNQDQHQGLAD